MIRPATLLLTLTLCTLGACTSGDPESGVVDDELLRPQSPQVQREGLTAEQGDPSRTGNCPQLSGQALRDCMERAQYQPEGSQPRHTERLPQRREIDAERSDGDSRAPRHATPERDRRS